MRVVKRCGGRENGALTETGVLPMAFLPHQAVRRRLNPKSVTVSGSLARSSSARLCGRSLCERSEILHVEDRSKADQTCPNLHFCHRRQVRELFRNLAPLGLNSLIISCAKLCMKANQLDLRAAFFMFFTSDAKSNRKYLLILLFSGLDGIETLFIALLALVQALP